MKNIFAVSKYFFRMSNENILSANEIKNVNAD
jgi:hypothetical protein